MLHSCLLSGVCNVKVDGVSKAADQLKPASEHFTSILPALYQHFSILHASKVRGYRYA
jgi:hypothetical protein